jgi:hypothetical protein
MTSPFQFKYPFPPQVQPSTPTTPSTPLSARQFIIPSRTSATPQSSLAVGSQRITDDIDDEDFGDSAACKKARHSSIHEFSSDEEEIDFDFDPRPSIPLPQDTPKRPPVILPDRMPDSDAIEFSPSRHKRFKPDGLASFASRIIHEYNARGSVALPGIDKEDNVAIVECKAMEGGQGWICQADSAQGSVILILLASNVLSIARKVRKGDTISISNAIRLDTTWICTLWRHKTA